MTAPNIIKIGEIMAIDKVLFSSVNEAIATGTAVVVPTDLFDERQRAIEEAEAAKAEARAMRQREEADRLAMWALDYDEDHPDYDHYYKQFLRAIKWGEQIKKL